MLGSSLTDLAALMARLRAPGGCPWDRQQSLESLKTYLVEETYEVLDAMDSGDPAAHQEELGDLLLQIVFHSELRRENGQFDIDDVIRSIHDKLQRRHPHVFGGPPAANAEEVLERWERQKAAEKVGTERPSLLDHVPAHFPALLRALRLTEKAARVGFDWVAETDLLDKLQEEMDEMRQALEAGQTREVAEELGDFLFVVANLARRHGIDPEEALRAANRKFERRFRHIETALQASGRRPDQSTLGEMNRLWDEAKMLERGKNS